MTLNIPNFLPGGNMPVIPKLKTPIDFLWATMTKPLMYGWFHVMCLAAVVVLSVLIILRRSKITDKMVHRALGVFWVLVLIFEIIKQINFSYSPSSDDWTYQWYIFPFQFCSSILYVLPLALIIKNEKFKDFLYSFLTSFNLFAGIAVMLYPSTVFIADVCINIQTMVHHGLMVVTAVLLIATRKVSLSYKTVLKGLTVFSSLVGIAFALNLIFKNKDGFNMFYIDVEGCHLPILNLVFDNVPYPAFLVFYCLGFTICALAIVLVAKAVTLGVVKASKKS